MKMKKEANIEDLKDILRKNGMSTRPEYYSGRGATLTDLNSDILIGIQKGLKQKFGKEAALGFLEMVKKIKVLSATTFIEELYMLHANNWKVLDKERDCPGISVPKNEDGEHDIAAGIFGVMESMFSSRSSDQTGSIRGGFLFANGEAPSEVYNSANGTVTMYFN